ncbi:MAG: 2-amino-4-hydroxy-6-hydroxymethyldihydropteridine diphosphokinase [Candidatus Pelagibacterales bacterium]|tara:strand:- start:2371 stop:2889 length:519 start_codon:yes stop_codon:yes gene_type:complete
MIYLIAIGSNAYSRFGSPINNLKNSIKYLEKINIQVVKKSSIYLSPPKDFSKAAGTFYNAVIMVNTSLKPKNLLRELKKIESLMGRYKYKKNTSRACDLDIILQKSKDVIKDDASEITCIIPHPQMCSRNFVMTPLREICPNWRHPIEEKSVITIAKRKFFTDRLYKATNVL